MAQFPPDPLSYGSAQRPVRQDPWSYIVEVGWPGGFILVELPVSDLSFYAPLGCYLVPLDAQDALLPVSQNARVKTYPLDTLLPKKDEKLSLSTIGILNQGSNDPTILSSLESVDGLQPGRTYFVVGDDLQHDTCFTYDGHASGTLSQPNTATGQTTEKVTISDWIFQALTPDFLWLDPPLYYKYTTWTRPDDFLNSGYWGDGGLQGIPLNRHDAVSDVQDISTRGLSPTQMLDWRGPISRDKFYAPAVVGMGDQVDFFFTNWFTHDDTVLGPRFHTSPKFGPVRANWDRSFYMLVTEGGSTPEPYSYRGWQLTAPGPGCTVSGPNGMDTGYPDPMTYSTIGGINIWQIRFPVAWWYYQYVIDIRRIHEVVIVQQSTQFRTHLIDLVDRLPGFSASVSVRAFGGGVRLRLDRLGRLQPIRVDQQSGTETPATEEWSHIYGPLSSELSNDVELGRFNKAGPTASPLPS